MVTGRTLCLLKRIGLFHVSVNKIILWQAKVSDTMTSNHVNIGGTQQSIRCVDFQCEKDHGIGVPWYAQSEYILKRAEKLGVNLLTEPKQNDIFLRCMKVPEIHRIEVNDINEYDGIPEEHHPTNSQDDLIFQLNVVMRRDCNRYFVGSYGSTQWKRIRCKRGNMLVQKSLPLQDWVLSGYITDQNLKVTK